MTVVGYRKFIVTVLAQVCTTGLCAFGVLTGGEFVAGMIATTGAFITLNVVQKGMAKNAAEN